MKLYITRHGKTTWNEEGRLQGFMNSALTPDGVKKAIELSYRIKNFDITAIVTSDLKRAKDTSYYVRAGNEFPIFYFSELREMSFGDWEGMTIEQVKEKDKEMFEMFEKDPLNYDNKTGETFKQLIDRVQIALDKIKKLNYENTLIITHGITVKALQTILENRDLKDISKLPVITGCTRIAYEINDDNVEKIMQDDIFDFVPENRV